MPEKSLRRLMNIPDCRETSLLLSRKQDVALSLRERIGLRLHLLACDGCRQFERQLAFLRTAVKRYLDRDGG